MPTLISDQESNFRKSDVDMEADNNNRIGKVRDIHFLRDQAYAIIKEAILSLTFKPGARLKETALASELGISKTPVREALTRLEHEGLIQTSRFRGAIVAPIDERDVEEIIEIRELLEGAAVKRAALNFSSDDLQLTEALLKKMREAYKTGDIEAYVKPSGDFHNAFINKYGNKRMISTLRSFDDHLERIRQTAIHTKESIPSFIEDYQKIFDAWKSRNPDDAESALLTHLKRVKDFCLKK